MQADKARAVVSRPNLAAALLLPEMRLADHQVVPRLQDRSAASGPKDGVQQGTGIVLKRGKAHDDGADRLGDPTAIAAAVQKLCQVGILSRRSLMCLSARSPMSLGGHNKHSACLAKL